MTDWLKELDKITPILKKSEVRICPTDRTYIDNKKIKPFYFNTTDGEGTYISDCQTVEEAKAELEQQFLNKLVSVRQSH